MSKVCFYLPIVSISWKCACLVLAWCIHQCQWATVRHESCPALLCTECLPSTVCLPHSQPAVSSSFLYCWGLCGALHSPLGIPPIPKLWSQVTTHHKGYVLVTVLLLGRGTMTKLAYKRQHLSGNLLQFQRVSSSWSWWELSGRCQAWCWNGSWAFETSKPTHPQWHTCFLYFSFFQKCTNSLLVLRVW